MPVWGRLFEADNGAFHKLEKARVSLGRRGGDADILIDATPNRCGDFITSAKHFELHYRGDKFLIVDTSTNGTFVNIDENNSDPTNEANVPNPRLERNKEQQLFEGDIIYLRSSHKLNSLKKFVFYAGPGDVDTSDGEDSSVVPSSVNEADEVVLGHREAESEEDDEDDEENWAPLPRLSGLFGRERHHAPQAQTPQHATERSMCSPSNTRPEATRTASKDGKQIRARAKNHGKLQSSYTPLALVACSPSASAASPLGNEGAGESRVASGNAGAGTRSVASRKRQLDDTNDNEHQQPPSKLLSVGNAATARATAAPTPCRDGAGHKQAAAAKTAAAETDTSGAALSKSAAKQRQSARELSTGMDDAHASSQQARDAAEEKERQEATRREQEVMEMRECGSSANSNKKKGGEQVLQVLKGETATGSASKSRGKVLPSKALLNSGKREQKNMQERREEEPSEELSLEGVVAAAAAAAASAAAVAAARETARETAARASAEEKERLEREEKARRERQAQETSQRMPPGGAPHGRGGERSLAHDQDAKMREQHTEKLKNDLLVLQRKFANAENEISNLTRLREAANVEQKRSADVEMKLKEKAETLEKELGKKGDDLLRLRGTERDLLEKNQRLQKEVEELKKANDKASGQVETVRAGYMANQKELESTNSRLQAQTSLNKIQFDKDAKDKQDLRSRVQALEIAAKDASSKMEAVETQKKQLEDQNTALSVKISELERAIRSERNLKDKALTSLDQVKNDAKKNQADLEEEHKKKMAALQREKEVVHAELSQANASIKRLQGLAKEEALQNQVLQAKLMEAKEAGSKAEAHNAMLTDQKKKLSSELEEQRKQLREQEQEMSQQKQELVALRSHLAVAQRESEQLQRKNEALRQVPDKLKRMNQMFEELTTEVLHIYGADVSSSPADAQQLAGRDSWGRVGGAQESRGVGNGFGGSCRAASTVARAGQDAPHADVQGGSCMQSSAALAAAARAVAATPCKFGAPVAATRGAETSTTAAAAAAAAPIFGSTRALACCSGGAGTDTTQPLSVPDGCIIMKVEVDPEQDCQSRVRGEGGQAVAKDLKGRQHLSVKTEP